jgi:hypothetical protein
MLFEAEGWSLGGKAGTRRSVFRALAGNKALIRVVAAYALFIVTEYSVWIAMRLSPGWWPWRSWCPRPLSRPSLRHWLTGVPQRHCSPAVT